MGHHAVVARQVIGAGQAGVAAADDRDIGVEIAGHRIAAGDLFACRGRPIGIHMGGAGPAQVGRIDCHSAPALVGRRSYSIWQTTECAAASTREGRGRSRNGRAGAALVVSHSPRWSLESGVSCRRDSTAPPAV
jgi:hypothetical protein